MKLRTKLGIATAAVVLAGAVAAPAFAEGSYGWSSFSSANPGFASQSWTDHQNDSNATKVAYRYCAYSNGEAVTSLTVELWDQHGIWPDQKVGVSKLTSGCGSVSWAKSGSNYVLQNSTFFYIISQMNKSWVNRWMSGQSLVTY